MNEDTEDKPEHDILFSLVYLTNCLVMFLLTEKFIENAFVFKYY